jgi:superoxide dismutase, Fe-Mn family
MKYETKNYTNLMGMKGFSQEALSLHFSLYEGYVKNTNTILEKLDELAKEKKYESIEYSELKRRFGWEFNGMRLHELYFNSLGGSGIIGENSKLFKLIENQFGSFELWRADFVSTAKIRGIGWVILYQDPESGKLMNFWVNEHDAGHGSGLKPILNMDLFEHAYMIDYGKDRAAYIEAFLNNVDWNKIEKRISMAERI